MAKAVHNDVIDAALGLVRSNAAPADYADADATALANADMVAADFTLSDGLVSGRRLSVAPKPNVTVIAAGTASHVALLDPVGNRVLYVTTCPAQALAAASTVSFAGWDIEIGDPA